MAGGGCAALEGTARALALDSPRPGTPTHNELSAVRVVVLKQILSFQPRSYGQPLGLRFPGFRGYVVLSWVKGRGQGGQARRLVLGERHLGRLKHNCACAAPRPALCGDLYPEEVRLRVSWRPAMGFSKSSASSPHLRHQPGPLIATCACAVIFSHSGYQFTTFAAAPLPEAIAYRFFLVPFSTHVTELIL